MPTLLLLTQQAKYTQAAVMKISQLLSFIVPKRAPRRPSGGFPEICLMHEALRPVHDLHRLDDQTWHDLEMDAIYGDLDRCTTPLGQQWLYHALRSKTPDMMSLGLHEIKHIPLAEVQSAERSMRRLNASAAYRLIDYLLAYRPAVVPPISLLLLLAVAPYFLCIVGHNPLCYALAVGILLVNFFVSHAYALRIASSLPYLSLLNILADCAKRAGPVLSRAFFANNTIRPNTLISWVNIDRSALGDGLAGVFIAYLDTFVLLQLIVYSVVSRRVAQRRDSYIELTKAMAQMDASLSLREYYLAHPDLCVASVGQVADMACADLRHPLLKKPVGNTFSFGRELVVITGANMSGKSTFIKALAANYVLASAFGISHATRASFPFVPIKTSLSLRDTVKEGASYYLKEISRMREMLAEIENGAGGIYMIDEPLKGTNRPERIAILMALMKYLGNRSYFFLTTHDTDLAQDAPNAARYQFSSKVSPDGEIQSSYVMQAGVSEDHFAVALLERLHFPAELIRDAREAVGSRHAQTCAPA